MANQAGTGSEDRGEEQGPAKTPFTPGMREVFRVSKAEATRLGHDYIGPEHYLLGLIRKGDGLAMHVLNRFDVDGERLRAAVEAALPAGTQSQAARFTPTEDAKRVLETARSIAVELYHGWIGTEHMLLALIRVENTIPWKILRDFGFEYDRTLKEILAVIEETNQGSAKAPAKSLPPSPPGGAREGAPPPPSPSGGSGGTAPPPPRKPAKGAWGLRFLIHVFTVLLGVLVFWLLGFVVRDIKSLPGPDYQQIEGRYVDSTVTARLRDVEKRIAELESGIAGKSEQQRLVGDSSQNLQRTINQLLELQRLSLQKEGALSESEKTNLSTSLARFLESQKDYQTLNQSLADLTAQKIAQEAERRKIEAQLEEQRRPAREEYAKLEKAHRMRMGAYQLAILVPLLLVAGFLLARGRGGMYFPLYLAFGAATLLKAGFVIHEYFPTRYFKYVLILALLGVVARLLIHLIRMVRFPKKEWLERQYREAYERFLCPVCEYPIRTGPRMFLYWTRRTVHKVLPPGDAIYRTEPYTCPSCGTVLFEDCVSCKNVRHSLMPHCEHCGAGKTVVE